MLDRLPERARAPFARARAIYLGEEEERWDDLKPSVAALADRMADKIRHATALPE